MNKIIRFFYRIVCTYGSVFCKRDNNCYVFGAWFGQKYADNPKYFYLYCLKQGKNAIWITKNKEVYNSLKANNLPVELAYSKAGKEACKKAKYVFTCTDTYDVNENCVGNAILINLWHGIPIKKIMWDDTVNAKYYSLKFRICNALLKWPLRKQYMLSTSQTMTSIFERAFRLPRDRVLELGQPRNDGFFNGYYINKKFSQVEYDKLIVYLPTHRNEGKSLMKLGEILPLNELNDFCKLHNTLFLIKKHFYHNQEIENLDQYEYIVDYTGTSLDTQELLYNADVLVTDYSSCFIDYLLLDRPIVFYPYDYEEYQKVDREMYFKYEEVAPDEIAMGKNELIKSLNNVYENGFYIGDKQKSVKRIFYSEANERVVSPQILAAIEKLS